MTVGVKICGLTLLEDALAAAGAGADALGFVFSRSPRRVSPNAAWKIIRRLPPSVRKVGVFVDEPVEWVRAVRDHCGLDAVQLHGEEGDDDIAAIGGRVIKVVKVKPGEMIDAGAFPGAVLLLDTDDPVHAGGTGRSFDWSLAVSVAGKRPVILAGGLGPDNVTAAIEKVRPFAVDVSSGVEYEKGRKDHAKIEAFIRSAKSI